MKKNNKGYMLIEIILAFSITFTLLYFIMNIVIKIKNKNDDLLVSTIVATDRAIITNKLMQFAKNEENLFNCDNLNIEDYNTITYTDISGNKNIINVLNIYVNSVEKSHCENYKNKITIKLSFDVKPLKKEKINTNIEYRYGPSDEIPSLGEESGISFKLFNYSGDNGSTGNNINNNGVYDFFTFRGIPGTSNISNKTNAITDGDGFINDTRIKILPTLKNGYPVFNCQEQSGCNNFSLGYLFGSNTNPQGKETIGVTKYTPSNTLLQKDYSTGFYYYDSNTNAVDYDAEKNIFIVKNYTERCKSITDYPYEINSSEFLPFNYWDETKTLKTTESGYKYNYEQNEGDYWFGMTMEFDFYMPKNGKINNNDMIFSFSGDDDVWVFIDDILILDLGGTHGAVDGTINFATGEVNSYLNWNNEIGTVANKTATKTTIYQMYENANAVNKIEWYDNTIFKNNTKHTLKFFYLERGAAVSNCKIKFNIQALQKN